MTPEYSAVEAGLIDIKFVYKVTDADRRRFNKRLKPQGDCLIWTGGRGGPRHNKRTWKRGGKYGRFRVNGRLEGAHWFAYFDARHGKLPATKQGLQVAHDPHACKNTLCCNPAHLRMTTGLVNLEERVYSTVPGRGLTVSKKRA